MQWVIGDIHGMLDEFKSVLAQIDEKDKDAQIFCTGDFCDRGYDSKGVVDLILERGNIKCVRGNHDDVMDCILSGSPTEISDDQSSDAPLSSLSWFLNYGMFQTFASYGQDADAVRRALRSLSDLKKMTDKVPQSHHDFYKNLPLVQNGDGFFVVHASVVPECSVDEALGYLEHKRAMIWGRYAQSQIGQSKAWGGKVGYFGHTPTRHYNSNSVVFGNDMVLLDTGSFFSKKISAVCHETKEVVTS